MAEEAPGVISLAIYLHYVAAEQYQHAPEILGKNLEGKQNGRELYQYIIYIPETKPGMQGDYWGLLGMFEKMFGKRHRVEEKTKDGDFNAYYAGTMSFSELICVQYGQKYTQGYCGLIRYRNGINTVRRIFFA